MWFFFLLRWQFYPIQKDNSLYSKTPTFSFHFHLSSFSQPLSSSAVKYHFLSSKFSNIFKIGGLRKNKRQKFSFFFKPKQNFSLIKWKEIHRKEREAHSGIWAREIPKSTTNRIRLKFEYKVTETTEGTIRSGQRANQNRLDPNNKRKLNTKQTWKNSKKGAQIRLKACRLKASN